MAIDYPTVPGTRIQDRTGEQYGSWTVLRFSHRQESQYYWVCRCECGAEKLVSMNRLRASRSRQCGSCANRIDDRTSVLLSEYQTYHNMLDRCYNPRYKQYHLYGGRGIKVCLEWRNDFAVFLADMGRRPSPKHSIDRYPDQNGDYEPGNCRWATWIQQNRNRRNNHQITFREKTMCLTEWAQEIGIPVETLSGRINIRGWTTERALTTPAKHRTTLT